MSTPTQLTINDLAELRAMIEAAVERGAFKANEAKTVGEVYDRLNLFVEHVIKQSQIVDKTDIKPNKENQND
jgi:hypothetical protein